MNARIGLWGFTHTRRDSFGCKEISLNKQMADLELNVIFLTARFNTGFPLIWNDLAPPAAASTAGMAPTEMTDRLQLQHEEGVSCFVTRRPSTALHSWSLCRSLSFHSRFLSSLHFIRRFFGIWRHSAISFTSQTPQRALKTQAMSGVHSLKANILMPFNSVVFSLTSCGTSIRLRPYRRYWKYEQAIKK